MVLTVNVLINVNEHMLKVNAFKHPGANDGTGF